MDAYAPPASSYEVPVVPPTDKSDTAAPQPPQQHSNQQLQPAGASDLEEVTLVERVSTAFKERKAIVDQKLLSLEDARMLQISQAVNSAIGAMVCLEALLEMLTRDTDCWMQSVWLFIFGVLFVLSSLRISAVDALFNNKAGMDFLYRAGFRGFFLIYIGTLQFTWWFGILTGIFCFFAAIFNYYVMTTHPYFDNQASERAQQYDPEAQRVPGQAMNDTNAIPVPPTYTVTSTAQPVSAGPAVGQNAPPNYQPGML